MGQGMSRFQVVSDTLKAELAKPYSYGSTDCFFTGLAMIDALNGTSLVATYQCRYKTLVGAQKALRAEGHKSLVSFFEAIGGPRIAPLQATFGDIGVIALPVEGKKRLAEHVGVHDGRQWVVKTETGTLTFDSAQALAAFRT